MAQLAGQTLAAAPSWLLQPPIDLIVGRILERNPDSLRRLPWQDERRILIEPTDLPVAFLVRCHTRLFRLDLVEKGRPLDAAATIHGPISALIGIARGNDDGDALFFSRALVIEGDFEVVVALRNAVDGLDISFLGDVLPLPGPLVPLARAAAGMAGRLFENLTRDVGRLLTVLEPFGPREGTGQGSAPARRAYGEDG